MSRDKNTAHTLPMVSVGELPHVLRVFYTSSWQTNVLLFKFFPSYNWKLPAYVYLFCWSTTSGHKYGFLSVKKRINKWPIWFVDMHGQKKGLAWYPHIQLTMDREHYGTSPSALNTCTWARPQPNVCTVLSLFCSLNRFLSYCTWF